MPGIPVALCTSMSLPSRSLKHLASTLSGGVMVVPWVHIVPTFPGLCSLASGPLIYSCGCPEATISVGFVKGDQGLDIDRHSCASAFSALPPDGPPAASVMPPLITRGKCICSPTACTTMLTALPVLPWEQMAGGNLGGMRVRTTLELLVNPTIR